MTTARRPDPKPPAPPAGAPEAVRPYHLLYGGVLFVALFLALLPSLRTTRSRAVLGEPLAKPVIAPAGFTYYDTEAARRAREDALAEMPFPLTRVPRRIFLDEAKPLRNAVANPELLTGRIAPEHLRILVDGAHRDRVARILDDFLARVEREGLVREVEDPARRYEIRTGRDTRVVAGRELIAMNRLEPYLQELGAPPEEARALAEVIRVRFLPTLVGDEAALREIRAKVEKEVPVPRVAPEPGELLIPAGKPLDATDIQLLDALRRFERARRLPALAGLAGFLLIVVVLAGLYLRRYQKGLWTRPRHLAAFSVVTVITAFVLLVVHEAAPGLPSVAGVRLTAAAWPVSLAAMTLALFFGGRLAFFVPTFLAIAFLLAYAPRVELVVMFLFGNLVAALSTVRVRKRTDLVRTAAFTAAAHLLVLFSLALLRGVRLDRFAGDVLSATLSPFLAALVVPFLLPLIEWISGKASVFRLIELTDLDHPVLRRMLREAPGTFQHSQHVALLAEAAAEAIGANDLLCRVGGYFHDIGKLRRPEYFTENIQGGHNPHDGLKPSMSAKILKDHVADGVEDAKAIGLPEEVIACIPEHHGTTTISYFYHRALKERAEEENVEAFSYAYEGPRPRSKETALLMLADSVEAAARSLEKPTVSKIERTVRKVINDKFVDGELDESPLTLTDLNRVAEAFTHVLAGMHHARSVKYPEKEAVKKAEQEKKKNEPKAPSSPGEGAPPDLGRVLARILGPERAARTEVAIVSDEEIARVNERHLGHAGPTDVLAFDYTAAGVTPPPPEAPLGEILISRDAAVRQAAEQGWSVEREILHLAAHGALHLMGYDDATEEGREEMERKAREAVDSIRR